MRADDLRCRRNTAKDTYGSYNNTNLSATFSDLKSNRKSPSRHASHMHRLDNFQSLKVWGLIQNTSVAEGETHDWNRESSQSRITIEKKKLDCGCQLLSGPKTERAGGQGVLIN